MQCRAADENCFNQSVVNFVFVWQHTNIPLSTRAYVEPVPFNCCCLSPFQYPGFRCSGVQWNALTSSRRQACYVPKSNFTYLALKVVIDKLVYIAKSERHKQSLYQPLNAVVFFSLTRSWELLPSSQQLVWSSFIAVWNRRKTNRCECRVLYIDE